MDLLEFDALVVERSKAKVDVKVAPRLVVEQMLGGDPRLRRSPRRVQGLSDPEDLLAASARWFLEDRVLLLWHVESSGPVHATLSDPKLGRKGGVGGAFGSPFEDASAVSRAMGFLRSAEECHNGPPEIASRLFQKLTTTPALDLTCSSTQGRSPSAEEAALAGAIAPPLTSKPCAPGAAACTRLALVSPFDPLDHRVEELALDIDFPLEAGCYVLRRLRLPLGPTDVVHADASVRALFPAGPRSVAELAALEAAPPPARAAAGGGAGEPQTKGSGRCAGADCAARGRCLDVVGQCLIGGDADCKASELCKVEGWCSAVPGTIAMGPSALDTVCAAKSDADCASSEACAVAGQCAADGGRCVARSSAHCAASEACSRFGLCSLAGRSCRAASDADCQRSALCKEWHACHAESGVCR